MKPVSDFLRETIADNLLELRGKMQAACERRKAPAPLPRLVAVTKYAPTEWVRALYDLGERDFGESRPQQLQERSRFFQADQGCTDIHWHQIGTLQRNKARQILPTVALIHSVDSFRLLQFLEQTAAELQVVPRVLLQVNISGETSKSGFVPGELWNQAEQVRQLRQLRVTGLMTMAPDTADEQVIRPVFRGLRQFRDDLQEKWQQEFPLPELSMGMTGDYEIAIEEGATLVRIGSGIFAGCEQA